MAKAKYQTVNDLYPDPWLRAEDLPRPVIVKVARVSIEEIYSTQKREHEDKAVLDFVGKEKRLILNKTQSFDMADAAGSAAFADWPGTRIKLSPAVARNNKPTIKISKAPAKNKAAKAEPEPEPEPEPVDLDDLGDVPEVYEHISNAVPEEVQAADGLGTWSYTSFNYDPMSKCFKGAGDLQAFWARLAGQWDAMLNGPMFLAAKKYGEALLDGIPKGDAVQLGEAQLAVLLDGMGYDLESE